jgi:hypothetical protein
VNIRPALLLLALWTPVFAQPTPVRQTQGAMHGFLVVRSAAGAIIGHGEYTEFAIGDRVTDRLTLHFRDGSLDDETAVLTQRQTFQFVSDHHIQRGPFFKNAIDSTIEANGQVTIRTTDAGGHTKVETSHFDLPPDMSNGILGTLLLNIPHNGPGATFSMILPTGKGRLVKLKVTPDGTAPFFAVTGDRRTASLFRIKIDLGGVAGVVAPIIGKQPPDIVISILEGEVPLLVREVGQLAEDAPTISLELAGTSFPRSGAK